MMENPTYLIAKLLPPVSNDSLYSVLHHFSLTLCSWILICENNTLFKVLCGTSIIISHKATETQRQMKQFSQGHTAKTQTQFVLTPKSYLLLPSISTQIP